MIILHSVQRLTVLLTDVQHHLLRKGSCLTWTGGSEASASSLRAGQTHTDTHTHTHRHQNVIRTSDLDTHIYVHVCAKHSIYLDTYYWAIKITHLERCPYFRMQNHAIGTVLIRESFKRSSTACRLRLYNPHTCAILLSIPCNNYGN